MVFEFNGVNFRFMATMRYLPRQMLALLAPLNQRIFNRG
jgi:hypothetical protein